MGRPIGPDGRIPCGAMDHRGERFEQRWDASPAAVAQIRHAVVDFAREVGLTDGLCGDIALAVTEAATNAVVHAYAGAPGGTLTVRAERQGDGLHVCIRDDGAGVRPRPDSPGLGLGLPLIAQLTAQLELHAPEQGGTEVQMTFAPKAA
jgi:serine/threonine-protein kinase RsbW